MVEGHDRQLGFPGQLELSGLLKPVVGVAGQVELLVEGVGERLCAVELEGEPDAQAPEGAGELGGVLGVVGQAHVGEVLEVLGARRVGVFEDRTVPHDQTAAAVGQEHPLVGVEGDGVGSLDALESLVAALGELEEAAVGGVDVEPEVVLLGEVGQVVQGVDGAGVGGAGAGDDEERGRVALDGGLEGIDVDAEVSV